MNRAVNDMKVIVTAEGKMVCAERDKMLVFPELNENTEHFLERASRELDMRARSYDPVISLPI